MNFKKSGSIINTLQLSNVISHDRKKIQKRINHLQRCLIQLSFKSRKTLREIDRSEMFKGLLKSLYFAQKLLLKNKYIQSQIVDGKEKNRELCIAGFSSIVAANVSNLECNTN